MADTTVFKCPDCGESFSYAPPRLIEGVRDQLELTTGRANQIMLECLHCPAFLLLDLVAGTAVKFDAGGKNTEAFGSVSWDMTATEKVKQDVKYLNNEGDTLRKTGNTEAAKRKFEEALRLRKHDPLTWYNLGVCLASLGTSDDAIAAFRHATNFAPKMVQAWSNLGMLLVQAGRLAEAEPCFDRAIEADPKYPKAYLGKANCMLLRGEDDGAVGYLEIALKEDPSYAPARLTLQRLKEGRE